jgi:uncharacterized repeat protein (TIGR02543 family)
MDKKRTHLLIAIHNVMKKTFAHRNNLFRRYACLIVCFTISQIFCLTGVMGQSAQTVNPGGGAGLTDGLKFVVNTNGALSVYRENKTQYYEGYTWPTGDGSGVKLTFRFSQGTTYNINTASLFACSTTAVTTTGNTSTTSISGYVTSTISNKIFYVTLNVTYTHPNKYFLVDYIVRAPSDLVTPETVHLYLDHDSYILGSDRSTAYYLSNATGEFVGDFRTNFTFNSGSGNTATNCASGGSVIDPQPSATHGFKTKNGFRSYYSAGYSSRTTIGSDLKLTNTLNTATCIDDGIAVEFTIGPLSAGQTLGKGVLHCYGDTKGEFDNTAVNDPTVSATLSSPVTVNLTAATYSETEGSATHAANTIKIRVSGGNLTAPQVVNFTLFNGTAVQNTHYTYVKGFTIPAGNYNTTPQDLTLNNIQIVGNTTCDQDRTFTVSIDDNVACNDLINKGTTITSAVVTIVDDEVRPTVANTLGNLTYYAGQTVPAITLTSSPAGATFAWTNSNTNIGLAASGNNTATIPSFTATNSTTGAITATITVTPSLACAGTAKTYTITVNPKRTITYHYNSGTAPATANPADYVVGTGCTISNEPTRTGYTFSGWTCAELNVSTPTKPLVVPTTATANLNVYAAWAPVTYTVTYTLNGGTIPLPNPNPATYDVTSAAFTLKNPVKPGYTFTGWTGSNGVTAQTTVTVPTGSTDNKTYTANWSINTYTITYLPNGGTAASSPNKATYQITEVPFNINTTAAANQPTRTGYLFDGWTGHNITVPTKTIPVTVNSFAVQGEPENLTYTAQWSPEPYTITYTMNGGTNHASNPSGYNITSAAITLQAPTRAGYTFAGWTGSNGNTPQTSVTIPAGSTGNKTYMANWTAINYAISYKDTDGTTTITAPGAPAQYNDSELPKTFTSTPVKAGYTFTGWTGTGASGASVTIPAGTLGALTYIANWTANPYTITFNPNGGTNPTIPTAYSGYTMDVLPINGISITPTRLGYTFNGWTGHGQTNQTGAFNITSTTTGVPGNLTYTAQWTLNVYSITYQPNGTNVTLPPAATNPVSYSVISAAITLTNPTRTGYTFKGWSGTGLTGDANLTVTIPAGSTGNRTYTANWVIGTSDNYTISYTTAAPSAPGLLVSPSNPTTYNVETPTITLNNPSHPGYTFKGWSGTGLTGTNNMNVQIPVGSTGNRTYTANWALESSNNFTIGYTLATPTTPELITITANPTTYNVETNTFTLNNPSHPGYTFKGWSGTGLTGTNNMTVQIPKGSTGNRTYTANWALESGNNFTIAYTTATPTTPELITINPANPTSYNVETNTFTLNNPSHPGYTFKGWSGTGLTGTNNMTVTIPKGSYGNRTYTANWALESSNNFTIGYTLTAPNGTVGTITGTNPTTYNVETTTFTLINPTHPGYTFTGWSGTGLTGNANMTVTVPKGSTGNRTYTAHWELNLTNAFTITYTLTPPTAPGLLVNPSPANPVQYNVETATFTLNNPSHPGYTFKGWTGSNGNTPQTTVTIPVGSTGNKTYTANWALESGNNFAITYTLTPPSAPGLLVNPSPANPTTYNVETNTITLNNPSHPGYTFTGWTGSNGATPQLTVTIPKGSTGAKNYTANWTLDTVNNTFTIGYTLNTPTTSELITVSPPNPTSYNVETNTFTLTNPSHPGYTFTGWSGTGLTGNNNMSVQIPKGSTGNRTYTAHWTLDAVNNTFTIGYTLNTPTTSELITVSPPNPTSYNVETNTFTLTNPEHPGYTFTGWSGTGLTGNNNMSVTIPKGSTGNRTYTAHWSFDPVNNGFTIGYTLTPPSAPGLLVAPNPANPTTYNVQTAAITLNNPSHPGYAFKGWTGSNGMTPQTSVTIPQGSTGNKTYTANWEIDAAHTFTINYTPNGTGVTLAPANPTSYTIESAPITLVAPTRPGYTFTGWTGTDVPTPSLTVTIPTGSVGNRSFTAQWGADVYSITFDPNGGILPVIPAIYNGYDMDHLPVTGITVIPTRLGYTFKGWDGNGLSGELNPFSITTATQNVPGNLTFVAQWMVNTYNITYDPNGGVLVPGNPSTYDITQYPVTISVPPTHLDPRYTFIGWTCDELPAVPKQLAYSLPVNTLSDLTFRAQWARKLDDLNGGVNDSLYVCEAPKQLQGDSQGQAWEWTLPDGSQLHTRNISANQQGRYICRTDYGTLNIPDTLYVYFLVSGSTGIEYVSTRGAKIGRSQQFVLRMPPNVLAQSVTQWTVEGGGTIISATPDSLTAVWNMTGTKRVSVRVDFNHAVSGVTCTKTFIYYIGILERGRGFFVNQNVAGGDNDGSSWPNAYRTIQEALVGATPGDYIWVARGTYRPNQGESFKFLQDSVEIFGGFRGTEDYLYERDFSVNPTVMSGNNSSVVTANGCAGIRIDGFTIQGGRAEYGAGVFFTNGASGIIANSIVKKNTATGDGGGIYIEAPWYGYQAPLLVNVEVSGNEALNGGGIYNNGSDLSLLNLTIGGNRAETAGGLYNRSGSPDIRNTIIWGNVATKGNAQTANVLNSSGSPVYSYSLVGGSNGSGDSWTVALGRDGNRNRDVNPLFLRNGYEDDEVTLREGNYHLSGSSPAVDVGRNAYVQQGVPTPWGILLSDPRRSDLTGLPMDLEYMNRVEEVVDLGAYEYNSNGLVAPIIDREVILPTTEGVATNPGAGTYYVHSRDNFEFTFTVDDTYTGLTPVVTTSRVTISDAEGVKVEKQSDGSYKVTIYHIQDHIYIFINLTDRSSNVSFPGTKIWSYKGNLHVNTIHPSSVLNIYNFSGQLYLEKRLTDGETIIPLPQGTYLVTLDDGAKQKVIVK